MYRDNVAIVVLLREGFIGDFLEFTVVALLQKACGNRLCHWNQRSTRSIVLDCCCAPQPAQNFE